MAEWVEAMRDRDVLDVVHALGVPEGKGGCACPACGAERRHTRSRDKRAAVRIDRTSPALWYCLQCEVGGDAIDFVACHVGGVRFRELGDTDKAAARTWCCQWLGLDPDAKPAAGKRKPVRRVPPPPAVRREEALERAAKRAQAAPAIHEEPAADYPPLDEVRALWRLGRRVDSDPECAAWMRSRAIDPVEVADAGLCLVLPKGTAVTYPWAGLTLSAGTDRERWRSYVAIGLRLMVPLFDHGGRLRSLLFRRSFDTAESWPPKSMSARGKRQGLIMADARGRRLLAEGTHPSKWPSLEGAPWQDVRQPRREPLAVVVAEGEMDLLCWATERVEGWAPAMLAMFGGSWPQPVADRIPDGARVVIATDLDKAGEGYAERVVDSFGLRDVELVRWRAAA